MGGLCGTCFFFHNWDVCVVVLFTVRSSLELIIMCLDRPQLGGIKIEKVTEVCWCLMTPANLSHFPHLLVSWVRCGT